MGKLCVSLKWDLHFFCCLTPSAWELSALFRTWRKGILSWAYSFLGMTSCHASSFCYTKEQETQRKTQQKLSCVVWHRPRFWAVCCIFIVLEFWDLDIHLHCPWSAAGSQREKRCGELDYFLRRRLEKASINCTSIVWKHKQASRFMF